MQKKHICYIYDGSSFKKHIPIIQKTHYQVQITTIGSVIAAAKLGLAKLGELILGKEE